MNFIDLSVPINKNTPVYPGDPKTIIKPAGILYKNGYQDHFVSMGTHVGTHLDAPAHMIKNGKNLDQVRIDHFSGNGVYIKTGRNITLEIVKKATIKKGDIVFFHTGMSNKYFDKEYFSDYPTIPEEVANYLVEKKIKIIGVDMCSPDREPFLIHKKFLRNGILIIENLTNLSQLEGKKFKVYAFPIKLQIDGAPVRVVAEI